MLAFMDVNGAVLQTILTLSLISQVLSSRTKWLYASLVTADLLLELFHTLTVFLTTTVMLKLKQM